MQPELKFNFKSIKLNWTIGLKFNGIEEKWDANWWNFFNYKIAPPSELIYERHKLESVDNVN
jgi:hypothetical protein